MYKFLVSVLVIFITQNLFSQNLIVFDKATNTPLSYVTITLFDNDKIIEGNYTDVNGYVSFNFDLQFDRIELSMVGYDKLILLKRDITNKVFLNQKKIELNEVFISSNDNFSFENIGFITGKKVAGLGLNKFMEQSVFIDNTFNIPMYIHSFLFRISKQKKKVAFRLHFYRKPSKNSEILDEIETENIIRYLDSKTEGIVSIDVSKYNIQIPVNGIIIGIENLGSVKKSGELIPKDGSECIFFEYTESDKEQLSFVRDYSKSNEWKRQSDYLKRLLDKQFQFVSNKYPNATYGLKVYKE